MNGWVLNVLRLASLIDFLWLKQLAIGCILYGLVLGMDMMHSTRETC